MNSLEIGLTCLPNWIYKQEIKIDLFEIISRFKNQLTFIKTSQQNLGTKCNIWLNRIVIWSKDYHEP